MHDQWESIGLSKQTHASQNTKTILLNNPTDTYAHGVCTLTQVLGVSQC